MYLPDLVVRSRRVVTPGGIRPAALHIRGGRIIGVLEVDDVPEGCPTDDAADLVVMPGVVDTHVHVDTAGGSNGHAFARATRAAAAGGVTTIIDMAPYGRPTTSVATLEQKRRAANGNCTVDVGFWGDVAPGRMGELAPLAEAGVFGFRASLVVPRIDGAEAVAEGDLRIAMPALARMGAILMVHAALPGPLARAAADHDASRGFFDRLAWPFRGGRQYSSFLKTRPKEAENEAVLLLLELCREYKTRTHILHLASADALTPIFQARAARLPVTVETCPHYLFFVAEEVPDGETALRCVPPIRDRVNRELLWGALSGGLIQMVVSDHSPPQEADGGSGAFARTWGAVASVQLGLSAVWTVASARGHSIDHLAAWMCHAPARIAGLERKGRIDVGYDADLAIWDPDAEFIVEQDTRSPYAHRRLRGVVARVYLRGKLIYREGKHVEPPTGRLLVREKVSSARV